MCGFAAVFRPEYEFPRQLLARMDADLIHRGPDSAGCVNEPGFGLVFRRLSILDVSHASDQPMTDPTGRYSIVYNGEIYNYRQLRDDLAAAGSAPRTTGDTEVMLQAYMRWGDDFVERLEGMFAFVIVDRQERVALAGRDPFGIKPLYMLEGTNLVAFASEMRPFRHLQRLEPDVAALPELLVYNWAAGRLSNVRNVSRIPGGTLVKVRLDDLERSERRFLDPLETLATSPSPGVDAHGATVAAVAASVSAHLASDVGFSLQLSGGVDSSLVAALAASRSSRPLSSFGIKLDDPRHDEGPYRKMVVDRYGLDHREICLGGREYADALPRAVRHMEGPSPHGGCVMLMLLCDTIRETHKVVLTGEGADELFGGYARYKHWAALRRHEAIARLLPRWAWPDVWKARRIRRVAGRDAAVFASVYGDPDEILALFPQVVPVPGAREHASNRFRDFRDRLLAVDQSCYLESLLIRQDKMAMAASVEARVPFVHVPLARVVNAVPVSLRVPGGETKPLLKEVAARYLPSELLARRKVGLTLPYRDWLADPEGLGRYLDDLADANCRIGAFGDAARIRAKVRAFRRGEHEHWFALFRLIGLELWLRSFEPLNAGSTIDDSQVAGGDSI